MKLSVLYYSQSGHTAKMAEEIVKGICEVAGCEAKAFSIDAIDREFVEKLKVK